MIYFDNAATTFPKPDCVYDAVNEGMKNFAFNAGRGSYNAATNTFKMITDTREKVANIIKANPNQVVFTSSATESLNMIINGLKLNKGDKVYVSPFEHNSIVRTLYKCGVDIRLIPFNKNDWSVDYSTFNDELAINKPKAVIISHISNVTGYELPYNEIFKYSKKYKAVTILDSAQGFGIYPVDSKYVDLLVFAGHKSLYSVFGIAGFINISEIFLDTYKTGGTGSDSLNLSMPQDFPSRMEAGSLNSVAIYALNKSIDFVINSNFAIKKHELTSYLISKLRELDNVIIYCPENIETKGIVAFNIEGYTSDEAGKILSSKYDICVRTGYHCAPYIHDFINDKEYAGCIRVSLSGFNTIEEINALIYAIREMS